jgi:hypothetical protein
MSELKVNKISPRSGTDITLGDSGDAISVASGASLTSNSLTTTRRQHMAITKETQIGKIEVVGKYKSVQVRTDTVVMEDNEELSRKYHRHALMPDADIYE